MNKVTIDRELLEQVASEFEHDNDRYMLGRELRKVLAAPRQPEGDGLEVVGFASECGLVVLRGLPITGAVQIKASAHKVYDVPLCRLSDAQRVITELRDELDTLRQQLAERDATIERLEAGIPRIQEQSHQMRKLRDKLEGLLLDLWEYTHDPELEQRIEAALAEVKP